jgi:hypothetical protein
VWGTAPLTLPGLDVAPRAVFWAREEIAIDAFHRAVYAAFLVVIGLVELLGCSWW